MSNEVARPALRAFASPRGDRGEVTALDMTDVFVTSRKIGTRLAVNIATGLSERRHPVRPTQTTCRLHRRPAPRRRAGEYAAIPSRCRGVDSRRSGFCCALAQLPARHGVPNPGDRVLVHRSRWTYGLARDHHLDLPPPESDQGTRGRNGTKITSL
jgi:hypothetical protein